MVPASGPMGPPEGRQTGYLCFLLTTNPNVTSRHFTEDGIAASPVFPEESPRTWHCDGRGAPGPRTRPKHSETLVALCWAHQLTPRLCQPHSHILVLTPQGKGKGKAPRHGTCCVMFQHRASSDAGRPIHYPRSLMLLPFFCLGKCFIVLSAKWFRHISWAF